jgi:hypothetical protein
MIKILFYMAMVTLMVSCNDPVSNDVVQEDPAYSSSVNAGVISSSSFYTPSSSSQNTVVVFSSSSTKATEEIPVVETPVTALYVGEMGTVCTGFNINAVQVGKATEGYSAMASLCGNRAQQTTGDQPRYASVLNNWMTYDLALNETLRTALVSDVNTYGSTLRFYNAVDGYLRYVYIEYYGDGLGLLKQKAE